MSRQPGKGDEGPQLSEEELEAKEREESGLVRSGRLFGGLWAGNTLMMGLGNSKNSFKKALDVKINVDEANNFIFPLICSM